ncbi:MAG: hypothetical protein ACJZ2E_01565, partial [Thalassobaculaceae bacterium]
PGMDQPGMPSAQVFDPASGGFAPPEFGLPDPNPEGFTIPTPPPGDFFSAPPADFFDPGALPPVGGTELGIGSFAGPGPDFVGSEVPPVGGGPDFVGSEVPPVGGSPLDQAFQPAPDSAPLPFDPVADVVGGVTDAAAPQGPSPAPDPVAAPIAPDPGPAAPDPVADLPPPPDDPVAG